LFEKILNEVFSN